MRPATEVVLRASLPSEWRTTARIFREHEETSVASAYEKCADALEEALSHEDEALLTLHEAAQLSGYSADHLGRLVREGKIPDAGRKGAPRIARRDLPTKPGAVATATPIRELDRTQIVRSAINEGAG